MTDRPPSEMSRHELLAEVTALRARLSAVVASSSPAPVTVMGPAEVLGAEPLGAELVGLDAANPGMGPAKMARQAFAAHDRLAERDAILTAILDSAHEMVFAKDADGRYLIMSRVGVELAGLSPEQAVGRTDAELLTTESPDRIADIRAADRRAMALPPGEAIRFEEAVTTPGRGRRHYLTTKTSYRGPDGRPRGVIGYASDITDRVAAEAALRASEQRYRDFHDALPDKAWVTDARGDAHTFNRRWTEYTGLPAGEFGLAACLAVAHPDDRQRASDVRTAAIAAGRPYEVELRLRDAAGAYRWHLARVVPVRDGGGRVYAWVGTMA
ncbi:MAG TPA: PAS domain-containing protein, partial [Humisphaera sp.]